ncbi:MAG: pyruvate carboxylase, partial [Bacteroidota bacterium]
LCYTGFDKKKFTLQYYLDLAKDLEDLGAHILAIKDMSGLLKPNDATKLVEALKETVNLPIHLHTHDTSSIQAATYLNAINAGVDVVDLAIASMSGLTSQPNFNAVLAMMEGHERENKMNLTSLNQFSEYWEAIREKYYPFETELRSGTADIYRMEIPGGQYSNLRPQARALGLEDQFEQVKENYIIANELFGRIVKVTPSSKVVGDMALFMTANGLSKEDVLERGNNLSFPDSVKALMRGDLGQIKGGFPKKVQKLVLKGEKPYKNRPNEHLVPIDFKKETKKFEKKYGKYYNELDVLSSLIYPKVFDDYHSFKEHFGHVSRIPTEAFFYGLKANDEVIVEIEKGKNVVVKYLNKTEANEQGRRLVYFR